MRSRGKKGNLFECLNFQFKKERTPGSANSRNVEVTYESDKPVQTVKNDNVRSQGMCFDGSTVDQNREIIRFSFS